jgi:hypothetical protein
MAMEIDLLQSLAAKGYRSWKVPGPRDGEIASLMARIDSPTMLRDLLARVDLPVARILDAFATRMAALAVRRGDAVWIRHGLIAAQLAMSAEDAREVLPTYALLYRAAELIGIDAMAYFRELSYLTWGSELETPEEFALRRPEDKAIGAMGYAESTDDDGFVFRSCR